MPKLLITLFLLFSPVALWAAGGSGPAHLSEKDLKKIMYQSINVGAILIAGVYFLAKPVRQFVAQKHAGFLEAAKKSQLVREQAETEKKAIEGQLQKLEATADESVQRAKAEAADLKANMIQEAKAISERLRSEAEVTARLEIERAKAALRLQAIEEASSLARQQFDKSVSAEDHQRLNQEFIKNIEVVQS